MPYIGKSSDGFGIRERFTYLASNGDTSISGNDVNARSLVFTDPEYVDVYLNGVRLKKDTDFNLNTSNTVAGLTALSANDEVEIIVHDVFTLADMVSASSGGSFNGAVTVKGDLSITKDAAVVALGVDGDVTITHDTDDGLVFKSTATADDNPFLLTIQTGETDIAANDVLGQINFQAPNEGTGTDAILVAAGIAAISEGDFSSSSNATKLSFQTGVSEAAAEKMSLSSAGVLTTTSNIVSGGTVTSDGAITGGGLLTTGGNIVIPDAGNIGSASDTNALAISSAGVLTLSTTTDSTNSTTGALVAHSAGFADDVNIGDTLGVTGAITGASTIQGTTITATTAFVPDASDGATLGTASLEFSDLFLADGALIKFGDDQDINITHVADTGLTTNGTFSAVGITSSATLQGTTVTATTAFVPDANEGATLGTASLGFADLFLGDGGEILLGADQDVILRHDHNSGLIIDRANTSDNSPTSLTLSTGETDIAADDVIGVINFQAPDEGTGTDAILVAAGIAAVSEGDFSSSNNATKLSFRTAASEAASEKMTLSSAGNLVISGDASVGDDLTLASDAAVLNFGADSDINITHVHNTGLTSNGTLDVAGDITGSTLNADGDTAAGDAAAIGYTAAEGLILTGQGSTNDVTIKNDADADVLEIPTGTVNVTMAGTLDVVGDITGSTLNADGDTAAGDNAAIGYTAAEGLILTGQGSTNDVTIKNDADADVIEIPTGTVNVTMAGTLGVTGAITSSAGATITTADNAVQLTLKSTDADGSLGPKLDLTRDSASPANGDNCGQINFKIDNDAGESTQYGNIFTGATSVADGSESAQMTFATMKAGTSRSRMKIHSDETVFNEDSVDVDFRVEGNGVANLLFIDAGADVVLFGTADTSPFNNTSATGTSISGTGDIQICSSSSEALYLNRFGSDGRIVNIRKGGSFIGGIDVSTSAVTYATSSDYRLKENVDYDWDATTRLKQLKPARFNFIVDDTNTLVDGFLAHEVSSIVPEAITGEKDAVDDDGNIDPQGIDQAKLVPLLIKTVQEQQAVIESLTTRIKALEDA